MKRMTIAMLAVTAAFGLSACGQSNHSKMVSACVADGNEKKVCTCMADKLEASLSEEAFAVIAEAAASEGETDLSTLEDLSPMEQMSVGVNVMESAIACGVEDK